MKQISILSYKDSTVIWYDGIQFSAKGGWVKACFLFFIKYLFNRKKLTVRVPRNGGGS